MKNNVGKILLIEKLGVYMKLLWREFNKFLIIKEADRT
jgi:hypothetical protein